MERVALAVIVVFLAMPRGCSKEVEPVKARQVGAMETDTQTRKMAPGDVERVQPDVVYDRVVSGDALLVCAYKSDLMYWATELFGSIPFKEFEEMAPTLPKDSEIYFYCA